MGDFNCLCAPRDRSNSGRFRDESALLLGGIVQSYGLEDVANCASSGGALLFTHFQGTSHARLDRVYVSDDLLRACRKYAVDHVSFSDHCLVSFSLCSSKETQKSLVGIFGNATPSSLGTNTSLILLAKP